MSRYAKANQTIDGLKALIKKVSKPEERSGGDFGPYWAVYESELLKKDLSKVDVHFENVDYLKRAIDWRIRHERA